MYEAMNSDDPIPFVDPPLDYNASTLVDLDSCAVLKKTNWALPVDGPNNKKAIINTDLPPPPSRIIRR